MMTSSYINMGAPQGCAQRIHCGKKKMTTTVIALKSTCIVMGVQIEPVRS
jgi:hypothetical protein